MASDSKHIIGATAKLTETESGFIFPARIDTGAESCSLHVEKIRNRGRTAKSRVRECRQDGSRSADQDAEGNNEVDRKRRSSRRSA